MQLKDWKKDSPPFRVEWRRGYIYGFRYRDGEKTAWHITTHQPNSLHDYWIIEGRFSRIVETRWIFDPPSSLFVTDDEEATLTEEERSVILATIDRWEQIR